MRYNPKYEYQKIFVESLEDIYAIILEYNTFYHLPRYPIPGETQVLRAFYRGQSDAEWNIAPSLLHAKKKLGEKQRIYNFVPHAEMSLFDTIAYIQHYQTETRFIDFSTNPDIAAYFACSENNNTDGAIFIYSYLSHEPQWHTTVILSELTQLDSDSMITVRSFSELILNKHPYLQKRFMQVEDLDMEIISFLDHGFMVLPNDTNRRHNLRLYRQSGCFFVCGVQFDTELESCDRWRSRAGFNLFLPHSAVVPESLISGNSLVKLIIPKEIKKEILQKLEEKGITYDYLFPIETST